MDSVLKQMAIFAVELHFFGATKKLEWEELGVDVSTLPQNILSLGVKTVLNTKKLNPFRSARKRIQRMGVQIGVRYGTQTFAVFGQARAQRFEAFMQEEITRLHALKQDFLSSYEESVRTWARSCPAWEQQIIAIAPSLSRVASAFVMDFEVHHVIPYGNGESTARKLLGLKDQAVSEIAQEVKSTWEAGVTQRLGATGLLTRIADKADGLVLLESDFRFVVDFANDAADKLRCAKGELTPEENFMLSGVFNALTNYDLLALLKSGGLKLVTKPEPASLFGEEYTAPVAAEIADSTPVEPVASEHQEMTESAWIW